VPISGRRWRATRRRPRRARTNGAQFTVVVKPIRRQWWTSSVATLTVNSQPRSRQPGSRTVTGVRRRASRWTGTGTRRSAYQWQRPGLPISGATLASLHRRRHDSGDNGAQFTVCGEQYGGQCDEQRRDAERQLSADDPSQPGQPDGHGGQTAAFGDGDGTRPLGSSAEGRGARSAERRWRATRRRSTTSATTGRSSPW